MMSYENKTMMTAADLPQLEKRRAELLAEEKTIAAELRDATSAAAEIQGGIRDIEDAVLTGRAKLAELEQAREDHARAVALIRGIEIRLATHRGLIARAAAMLNDIKAIADRELSSRISQAEIDGQHDRVQELKIERMRMRGYGAMREQVEFGKCTIFDARNGTTVLAYDPDAKYELPLYNGVRVSMPKKAW